MRKSSSDKVPSTARKVIQIGPHMAAHGGIAAVLSGYSAYSDGFVELGYRLGFISSGGGSDRRRLLKFLAAWFKLIWLSLFGDIHLVHIHSSIKGSLLRKILFALTCFVLRRTYIMHIHSGAFPQYCTGLPRAVFLLVRFVLGNAARVIVLSEYARDTLISTGLATPEKCRLVYNGIADPLTTGAIRRETMPPVSITFLGKLCESKGLITLFEALSALPRTVPPYTLFVGGNGDASVFSELVQKYGLGDVVDYKGWVAGESKLQLLTDTRIFVLPSYSEGFPVAIVEAMAFATAIVSTRIPGVIDAIRSGQDGLLIEPGDVDRLRAVLLLLLSDQVMCQRFGASARQRFLDKFTIQRTARSLALIYDGLR
jgi:glycosyltransferase involved in cell wall biosynthesis